MRRGCTKQVKKELIKRQEDEGEELGEGSRQSRIHERKGLKGTSWR